MLFSCRYKRFIRLVFCTFSRSSGGRLEWLSEPWMLEIIKPAYIIYHDIYHVRKYIIMHAKVLINEKYLSRILPVFLCTSNLYNTLLIILMRAYMP